MYQVDQETSTNLFWAWVDPNMALLRLGRQGVSHRRCFGELEVARLVQFLLNEESVARFQMGHSRMVEKDRHRSCCQLQKIQVFRRSPQGLNDTCVGV